MSRRAIRYVPSRLGLLSYQALVRGGNRVLQSRPSSAGQPAAHHPAAPPARAGLADIRDKAQLTWADMAGATCRGAGLSQAQAQIPGAAPAPW